MQAAGKNCESTIPQKMAKYGQNPEFFFARLDGTFGQVGTRNAYGFNYPLFFNIQLTVFEEMYIQRLYQT